MLIGAEAATMKEQITLFIVEDSEVITFGLQSILGKVADFEVIGSAVTAEDAIEAIRRQQPKVLLLDLHLPGRDGLECLAQLKSEFPELRVVIFSMDEDSKTVRRAFAASADGYCAKQAPAVHVVEAIRTVMLEESWIDPGMSERILRKESREVVVDTHEPHANIGSRREKSLEALRDGLIIRGDQAS
jgi:DNA-binding NarL/FixJ family response regulator